jgi:hypothetical protein
MNENGHMTKSERRSRQVDEITAHARMIGIDLDVSDKESMRTALVAVMTRMGLDPEVVRGNGNIRCIRVDANGYKDNRTSIRPNLREMRAEMVRLVRVADQGGPWLPGDLDALDISDCGRAILEAHLGAGWRDEVSEMIRSKYELHSGYGGTYEMMDERVGIKLAQGRILVHAALGTAYYRNGNLVMTKIRLPDSTMTGIIGRDAASLMDGDPYGSAFTGIPVKHIECPERTTVIQLDETCEPASGREKKP